MSAGRASFEIQTFHDGHWLTEEIRETELTARAQAKSIFARPYSRGIRIVKNWLRADGLVTETVIHTEMRESPEPKVTIVPIDTCPYCCELIDYYRLESRATINRLFRKYVDHVFLTPTEITHHYPSLKKIQEVDSLFPSAVDRVASIQARETGGEPKNRRDEIYRAVAKLTDRARRAADFPKFPKLTGNNFDKFCARIEGIVPPGEADFYSLMALSRELVKHRNWLGKLSHLVGYIRPDQRKEALALLDGVLADIFGVATALQDILGYQKNLAEAICAIVDLCEGRFSAEKSDVKEQISAIAPLIADGRLTEARTSLMDRMLRQLASAQPLSRNDPSCEGDAFRRVALRLLRPDGLIGGSDTAEALTRRFVFMQETGGKVGLRLAVGGVVGVVTDPTFAVAYLLQLADSSLGEELSVEIVKSLRHVIGVRTIDSLVSADTPIQQTLLHATAIYNKISTAAMLPEDERQNLLEHLDQLLCRYLKRKGVIEKLDSPKAVLRERATRLIEFCAGGLLPEDSKAAEIARGRVVSLLKQPNFEVRFVEGLNDAVSRDEALRVFYALLSRAGFR